MNDPFQILFNPGSAMERSLSKKDAIEREFRNAGLKYEFTVSESEDHLIELARQAAEKKRKVIAIGGDSTIFQVFNELVRYSVKTNSELMPFGMIGTGSSNDIMKAFNIDSIQKSIQSIKNNRYLNSDIIELKIPDHLPWYYIGQSNIGIGAFVNDYVEEKKRQKKKWASFQEWIGFFAIFRSFQKKQIPLKFHIQSDDLNQKAEYISLLFSKIPYWISGKLFIPNAKPDDGFIHCVAIQNTSFIKLIKIILKSEKGKHLTFPEIDNIQKKSFYISSEVPFFVQVDGDILKDGHKKLMTSQVHLKVLSKTVPVFAERL